MKQKTAERSFIVGPALGSGLMRRRYGPSFELEAAQLGALLNSSSQPLLLVDADDRICFANTASERLLDVVPERLQQSCIQSHFVALDRSQGLADGALERVEHGPCTLDLSLPDGRQLRATLTPVADRWGQPTHVCFALEEISQANAHAALEALGRLAGELAHDINNQLSAALNYVFILQRRLGAGPLAGHLEELHSAAWRAATLAGGLRLVGRKRSADPEYLRLGQAIEGLEPLLRHLARDVRLELHLDPGTPEVHAPLAYLEQVIVVVTLYALGRAPVGSTLRLQAYASSAAPGESRRARMAWELAPDGALTQRRVRTSMNHAISALRRALKRCNARLGHDERHVWVELESSAN